MGGDSCVRWGSRANPRLSCLDGGGSWEVRIRSKGREEGGECAGSVQDSGGRARGRAESKVKRVNGACARCRCKAAAHAIRIGSQTPEHTDSWLVILAWS